jgi:hypothetical protein
VLFLKTRLIYATGDELGPKSNQYDMAVVGNKIYWSLQTHKIEKEKKNYLYFFE